MTSSSITLCGQLPPLVNIIDEICIDEDEDSNINPLFTDIDEEINFIETSLQIAYEFITDNPTFISEPDFEEILFDSIKELCLLQFQDIMSERQLLYEDVDDEDLDDMINIVLDLFYHQIIPKRSHTGTYTILPNQPSNNSHMEKTAVKITHLQLKNKNLPVQRSKEWYQYRHNLITASNAYKAFENQNTQNQLIYEKCLPMKMTEEPEVPQPNKPVNISTTLHWGQKFEPISVMYYEYKYQTKIEDFGCIQHETYSFLGASPDGIICDPLLPNYGRMIEIKNIVNREIDGIPKKEYWIQMQLQMETCDLNECDFLETRFKEYETEEEFNADGNFMSTVTGEIKGIIMYFSTADGAPIYVYKPISMVKEYFEDVWFPEQLIKYEVNEVTWIKNIYWKLEEVSCVLVKRNKKWFQDNIDTLKHVWTIIEKERVNGYEHRAPNKRVKKTEESLINKDESIGCLFNINKETGKSTINTATPATNYIIKIRTESFDETKLKM